MMKKINKKKNCILYILCILGLLTLILILKKQTKQDHSRSEGSVVLLNSDGSKTNVIQDINNEGIQISTASANHNQPFSRGDFIVWTEEQQGISEKYIVRYHTPTKTTLYISTTGVAQNPKVNTQGQVVWQSWIDETWQIFFFDGNTTRQITSEQNSCNNPDIAGNIIVYSKKDVNNKWQAIQYSIDKKTSEVIKEGIEAKFPYFYGTELFFR